MTYLTDKQCARANALRWYHAIDFGSHQSIGRTKPPIPPNLTLFGVMDMLSHIDLNGMKCLEVGPAHGLISIGLALKGGVVTACDIGGGKPPQIILSEEVFGVNIDYRYPISLEKVPTEFERGSFDLIVCAGVMYHLINPADVFFRLRPLLKNNGIIVIETAYAASIKEPVLVLNSEAALLTQPTTYFLPSASAVVGMAKLACLDVLATRASYPSRFALVGRAVPAESVGNRGDFLKKIHATRFEDPMFRLEDLPSQLMSSSNIDYTGEFGHREIDVYSFIPDFPPHPKAIVNPVGLDFYS